MSLYVSSFQSQEGKQLKVRKWIVRKTISTSEKFKTLNNGEFDFSSDKKIHPAAMSIREIQGQEGGAFLVPPLFGFKQPSVVCDNLSES